MEIRGIDDEEDLAEFLSDKPQITYDPFLMKGMSDGVDAICRSADKNEKICVYGDYDCDGVTSVCLLTEILQEIFPKGHVSYYIPSRFEEGYGLNKGAIKKIHDNGVNLILTADCGSVSFEEVEYAKKLGMNVIVTDHHNIDTKKADCILINPKQSDCKYPFKGLCGCGVAYKLVQGLRQKIGFDRSFILRALDLVGIATIGDIVPLVDENRTITKYGINELKKCKRESLRILADVMSLKLNEISSANIAFGIVPAINACGRMDDAKHAVRMIMGKDKEEIRNNAEKMYFLNSSRRSIQEKAFEECVKIVEENQSQYDFKVIKADVHEGVAGIVAGKIKDKYNRPCIIVTESEGLLKGTGRSIPGVDIYEILKAHEDIFIRFGGHKSACGFLTESKNLGVLTEELQEEIEKYKKNHPEIFEVRYDFDMELMVGEVTMELAEMLKKFEPCGEGNRMPVFKFSDVDIEYISSMGKDGRHIKFFASQGGYAIECINFGGGKEILRKHFTNSNESYNVDLIGKLDINEFRGKRKLQIIADGIIDKRKAYI